MERDLLIDKWSVGLAERLIEIRFVDFEEMKAAITSHIKAAIMDCLKIQISETEEKLNRTKKEYALHGGGRNNHLQIEIISLKKKLKEENKFFADLYRENQAKELVLFLRKHNEDLLLSFYKYYDTKKNARTSS